MISFIKHLIKKLPVDITLNQKYDTQTRKVIARHCSANSNCIDVGCHKGEIMDLFLHYAPNGHHIGFEPIPALFENLKIKYEGHAHCTVSDIALSNQKGSSSFNYVVSNPAYSGLVKRTYDRKDEKDTSITVITDLLDNVLPSGLKTDLIKIDVEGGEYLVLKGAVNTLKNDKPIVIFEHGLGASDCYGTTPLQVFELFRECDYEITTMDGWLKGKKCFSLTEFEEQYQKAINYYFLAYSVNKR
jgi:FkbM family methyltransferase